MSLSVTRSSVDLRGGGAALAGACWRLRGAGSAVRQSLLDQFPQFFQSFARRCRNRQHGRVQTLVRAHLSAREPFGARQLVDLGGHDAAAASSSGREPVMGCTSLSRPGCRASTSSSAATAAGGRCRDPSAVRPAVRPEILPCQRFERVGRRRAAARVSVARQIHEVERRARPAGSTPVEVHQPGLAGRRARARDLRAAQRVDQARLADVRAADQRDSGRPSRGKSVGRSPRW